MAYKIPAQVIRNVLIWGKGHSYEYESFIKTIRKKDLINFYSNYRCKDLPDLEGSKQKMFNQIKKCFDSKR